MRRGFLCRMAFFMERVMTGEYIAIELQKEAANFVDMMSDDVWCYKVCRSQGFVKDCEKGDRFAAWWNLRRYEENPHSLVFLYEKRQELLGKGAGDLQDAFMFTAWCMEEYFAVIDGLGCV